MRVGHIAIVVVTFHPFQVEFFAAGNWVELGNGLVWLVSLGVCRGLRDSPLWAWHGFETKQQDVNLTCENWQQVPSLSCASVET
jgi:hypothetical protein